VSIIENLRMIAAALIIVFLFIFTVTEDRVLLEPEEQVSRLNLSQGLLFQILLIVKDLELADLEPVLFLV
jgi:hypothetical protein